MSGFSFDPLGSGQSSLRVLGAYDFATPSSVGQPRKYIHPFWVLSCRFTLGEMIRIGQPSAAWQRIAPDTVMLIPPETRYWQDFSQQRAPVRGAFLFFRGGESAGLQRFFSSKSAIAWLSDPEQLLTKRISEAARTAALDRDRAYLRVHSILYDIVDRLYYARVQDERGVWSFEGESREKRNDPSFYDQVCGYLSARLSRKVTIPEIARHFGLSVPGLFKKFARETSESPKRTFAKLRMEQAKGLLIQGEPLKSIADRMGFCDAYHFSKAFKQYSGSSPREYLRALNP